MNNESSGFLLPDTSPEADGAPLYRKLCERLRLAILDRQFAPGQRLPATRELARQMDVSRNTVTAAYEQLIAEGYLESKRGSGTYVSADIPDDFLIVPRAETSVPPKWERAAELPERARAILTAEANWPFRAGTPPPLAPCVPGVDDFPFEIWAKLAAQRLRRPTRSLFNQGEAAGFMPLRREIAAYLNISRGVRCSPEQVIIVSGTQQAADLTARVLLDAGDTVWAEDPGYHGTRAAFTAAGVSIAPVPLDEEGICVKTGKRIAPEAKLACVTPSHQYPLGLTMTVRRRCELLEWARESGGWIFEDDYDSEFRYGAPPLTALQGLDRSGRVIYAGSFTKVLTPSLRLGYLVVPETLVGAFTAAKAVLDRHSPVFEQTVLADFFARNHFDRHLRRMRKVYGERRKCLVEAVDFYMKGLAERPDSAAGLHLTVRLINDGRSDTEVAVRPPHTASSANRFRRSASSGACRPRSSSVSRRSMRRRLRNRFENWPPPCAETVRAFYDDLTLRSRFYRNPARSRCCGPAEN